MLYVSKFLAHIILKLLPNYNLMNETEMEFGAVESGISIIGLFLDADPVVKLVLLALLIASIWSWAIVVTKFIGLNRAKRKARKYEDDFWTGGGDSDPSEQNAIKQILASVSVEWTEIKKVKNPSAAITLLDRAERSMRTTVDREIELQSGGLGVLASVGSVSPFIGLFGTVWGIMNAFIEIGVQQDTSLATVAGPIAEALFATGLGLIAAIPAVIFYNKFSGDLGGYADQLDSFCQKILLRLSRRVPIGDE